MARRLYYSWIEMQNTQERIPRYARNDIHAESVLARSPGTALDPLDRPPWSGLRPDLEAQRASNLQGDVAIRPPYLPLESAHHLSPGKIAVSPFEDDMVPAGRPAL